MVSEVYAASLRCHMHLHPLCTYFPLMWCMTSLRASYLQCWGWCYRNKKRHHCGPAKLWKQQLPLWQPWQIIQTTTTLGACFVDQWASGWKCIWEIHHLQVTSPNHWDPNNHLRCMGRVPITERNRGHYHGIYHQDLGTLPGGGNGGISCYFSRSSQTSKYQRFTFWSIIPDCW